MFLRNKVALVTGAGRGIGKHISLELARNGSALVVNDINAADVEETANQARELGVEALEVVADVSNFAEVESMVRTTVQNFSRLDILINNAGVISTGLIQNLESDEWDRVMDVNLKGVFNTCRACIDVMISQNGGKIVNMASIAAHRRGGVANTIYATSKAGVIAFTRGLAKEVASKGINVNAISPAVLETDMTRELVKDLSSEDIGRLIPKGRLGKPSDVTELVLFLVSDKSDFITGEVIALDGGYSI